MRCGLFLSLGCHFPLGSTTKKDCVCVFVSPTGGLVFESSTLAV